MQVLQVRRGEQRSKLRRESNSLRQTATAIQQKIVFAELEEVAAGTDFLRASERHKNNFIAQVYHLRRNDNRKLSTAQRRKKKPQVRLKVYLRRDIFSPLNLRGRMIGGAAPIAYSPRERGERYVQVYGSRGDNHDYNSLGVNENGFLSVPT